MTFDCLDQRRSVPSRQLAEPGPDMAQLLAMLQAASRVPDHGKRVPFRFLRIAGDARNVMGELLASRKLALDPEASDAVIQKERERFSFAPVIVTVIAEQGYDEKIPASERFSTASCVCFALLQAAQAAGFGAQWDSQFVHPIRETLIAADDAARHMGTVAHAIRHHYNGDPFQRVIYTESHDEVANGRARVPETINPGAADSWHSRKWAALGLALTLTANGLPMRAPNRLFGE